MNTLHKVSVIVRCPYCRAAIRWTGRYSRRETCASCKKPFIVLHDQGEACEVAPDSPDAIGEMVCDWLGPRNQGDDQDETLNGGSALERKAG